ncbi:MAG: type transport system ATP-binding protein [Thermomicrobiales bacterium]|nr:type transport system ATP-binding protein [Thermomicrobiales bacterium]
MGKELRVDSRNAIELINVEKRFSKKRGEHVTALAGISLEVGRGEVVGILGPNGSGKSTLVRVLSTLILPDSGEARIFGVDAVRNPRAAQRMMNRVSVEASFFKKLSAWENLLYSSKFYGVTSAEAKPKIGAILSGMGFDMKRASEPMEHLSRGMQQKIALARALLTSPMLMLLDEPTTGLDPRSKKDVQAVVRSIREEHDASILLCTHDMDEAEELCDRVGIIVNGKIVELDEPTALKRRYQTDGQLPNLEEVFMAATGSSFEEAEANEDEEVAA